MEGNSYHFKLSDSCIELYIRTLSSKEYQLIAQIHTDERKRRWERLLHNVDWHKEKRSI